MDTITVLIVCSQADDKKQKRSDNCRYASAVIGARANFILLRGTEPFLPQKYLNSARKTAYLMACPHCRRKVRLSLNSATVAVAVVSPFPATVALFCDSVDRA